MRSLILILILLTAVAATAQPLLEPLERSTPDEVRLKLTVADGNYARIDTSTNLLTWSELVTVGAGSTTNTDTFDSSVSGRYYRAASFPGDLIATTNGPLIIRPVTHASFVMRWNGKAIYNDPDSARPAVPYSLFPKADLVLISHEHSDHWDAGVLNITTNTGVKIIAPALVYNNANFPAALKPSTIILANGESATVHGIDVLAVPAYNGNHPVGNGNGYVVTIGGKRFYMAGDTSDTPEMRALTDIDVAFIPMNSFTFTTGAAAAAPVRVFQPKIVFPYHYSGSLGNPAAFKTAVGTDLPIEVRLRNWYP